MRPSFLPRLINGPFGDPGLFIPFQFEKHAFLFDLGDISHLSSRDILKITHVFVSHTHIDHFYGFDRLIRILVGRDKALDIFGPPGIIGNVAGKLSGYTWNLVDRYEFPFIINVTEVSENGLAYAEFRSDNRFETPVIRKTASFNGLLYHSPKLKIHAAVLDHKIPSLAFSLNERFHVNIQKRALDELQLNTGPWLGEFKQALFEKKPLDTPITVPGDPKKMFTLEELSEKIAIITPGQKIAYITDTVFSDSVLASAVELCRHADHLFIEAAFSENDQTLAREKYHLTAAQAGIIAGTASVKQFTLFHFSPRYTGMEKSLIEEAQTAYKNLLKTTG